MKKLVLLLALMFGGQFLFAQDKEHDANAHMHRNSTDRLINVFNNPERDKWQKPELVIAKMGDLSDKTVMDLGAGPGYFTMKLADHAAKVIAAEPNQEFVDHLNQELNKEEFSNYRHKIDVRKIPYDSPLLNASEVDFILLVNAYHHVENRVEYFRNVLPGLKSGGKLMIVDYTMKTKHGPPQDHKLAAEVVLQELKSAGYQVQEYDTETLPRQYVIIAGKQ